VKKGDRKKGGAEPRGEGNASEGIRKKKHTPTGECSKRITRKSPQESRQKGGRKLKGGSP